ncbi:MAG: WD40 repeat domain-containing protein, partial [Proteobacteria bacterium]|nr:WD40 repeat domain-containing protein [Pseudomonadota bacterium]
SEIAYLPQQSDVDRSFPIAVADLVAMIDRAHTVLVKRPGKGAVTALAWSADGQHLALGTESGFVGRISLSDWRIPS